MSIFKKKKLDTKDKEINDLSWKVRLLKDEVDSLVNTIKEHKLSSLTYPYVKIYTCLDDYQEEKEKYQSKGYTLSGCCCNYEVWVKKGDKHE